MQFQPGTLFLPNAAGDAMNAVEGLEAAELPEAVLPFRDIMTTERGEVAGRALPAMRDGGKALPPPGIRLPEVTLDVATREPDMSTEAEPNPVAALRSEDFAEAATLTLPAPVQPELDIDAAPIAVALPPAVVVPADTLPAAGDDLEFSGDDIVAVPRRSTDSPRPVAEPPQRLRDAVLGTPALPASGERAEPDVAGSVPRQRSAERPDSRGALVASLRSRRGEREGIGHALGRSVENSAIKADDEPVPPVVRDLQRPAMPSVVSPAEPVRVSAEPPGALVRDIEKLIKNNQIKNEINVKTDIGAGPQNERQASQTAAGSIPVTPAGSNRLPTEPVSFESIATENLTARVSTPAAPPPIAAVAAPVPSPVAIGTAGNSGTVPMLSVDAPVLDAEWSDAMPERVVWMAENNVRQAQIRLNPVELGPLQVRLAVEEQSVNVVFTANHAVTRAALESALPQLRDMLAESGLSLGEASVSEQGVGDQQQRQELELHQIGDSAPVDAAVTAVETSSNARSSRRSTSLLDTYA